MKKILLLSILLVIPAIAQYTITVDGNPSDWDNNDEGYNGSQLAVHGSGYYGGQWIYRGESSDQRTDIGNNADNDITEVRFGTDGIYLYFLVRMQNIENGGDYVYVSLSIDTDQNGSDGSLNWNGDDSQTGLGSAVQNAERNLTIHDVTSGDGTNIQFELFADGGSSWYAPPTSGAQVSISTSNEVVEGRIALSDLNGITGSSTIRVSLATFVNGNNGYNNSVDATQDIGGGSISDGIDVMSPGSSSSTNAWVRDFSDGDIDNSALIILSSAPIPVEISSFSSIVLGKSVNLNWQTATEVKNYGFEVERALSSTSPSQDWKKIGFVNGHGNSNSPKSYSFTDKDILNGSYNYRLKQIDTDGKYDYSPTVEVTIDNVPTQFELSQNYPNPFNPSTVISYALPSKEFVQLKVFNVLGNEIATLVNEVQEAGNYKVEFNPASSIQYPATGVYFYRLEAGSFVDSRKMTLVK